MTDEAKTQDGSVAANPAPDEGPLSVNAAGAALEGLGLLADDPVFGTIEEDEGQGDEESQVGDEEEFEEEESSEEDFEDPDEVDDTEIDDEPDDEASEESELYTVKVDGEELEVTLDEALAGYQRGSAFTRKTQELAEERQTLQTRAQELATERAQYQEKLQVVQRALQVEEPDWNKLKAEDPDQYVKLRAAYQERREQIEAIQAEIEEAKQANQEAVKAALEEHVRQEQEMLVAKVPEWVDQERRLADLRKLGESAVEEYGFTQDDLLSVRDHRLILLLKDAIAYREMQSKTKETKKQVRSKRRKSSTLQPGSSSSRKKKSKASKKVRAARKQLAQTGSVDDAAAALDHLLPEDII